MHFTYIPILGAMAIHGVMRYVCSSLKCDKVSDRPQWIKQHDAISKKANKPVVLKEYGTPLPHNRAATDASWQASVFERVDSPPIKFGSPVREGQASIRTVSARSTRYSTAMQSTRH